MGVAGGRAGGERGEGRKDRERFLGNGRKRTEKRGKRAETKPAGKARTRRDKKEITLTQPQPLVPPSGK